MLAYAIVTGKVPFSELGQSISPVALGIKVTNGYRPKFPNFVPKKMQNLISRCWNGKPENLPTFEEIFNVLSNDFTILGEIVDKEKVHVYLSILNKESKSHENDEIVSELRQNLEILKKRLSIYESSNETFVDALHKMHGNKQERNLIEAQHYLMQSSEKGNSYASYLLGLLYVNGEDGFDANFERGKFTSSAHQIKGTHQDFMLLDGVTKMITMLTKIIFLRPNIIRNHLF